MFIYHRSKEIRVSNCVSNDPKALYSRMIQLIEQYSREYPTKYTMMYPNIFISNNPVIHSILQKVHAFIPAYCTDVGLRLMGAKPMAVKILKAVNDGLLESTSI